MLDSGDARLDPAAGVPPPADASRRRIVLGATAFLALALAGCSGTGGANGANGANGKVERRCVVMGPSGSRGKRMIHVPCDTEGAQ